MKQKQFCEEKSKNHLLYFPRSVFRYLLPRRAGVQTDRRLQSRIARPLTRSSPSQNEIKPYA